MDAEEFRKRGREVIEFIVDYYRTISNRNILPTQKDGYLRELQSYTAPTEKESFSAIMEDLKNLILPGIVHCRHPRYFGYFPSGSSFPSLLADMLVYTINCAGFSWAAGPACTELETITLDWLGKMLGLPDAFLSRTSKQRTIGGGVFQVSPADALLVAMIAARHVKIQEIRRRNPSEDKREHLLDLVAYCSTVTYATIKQVASVVLVQVHVLETDEHRRLTGDTLKRAIKEDRAKGLYPFFVFASMGTIACCSWDAIREFGPICERYGVWLHVDGAYAGSALICPEFKSLRKGINYANSFSIDPSIWMLVNFDCCALWIQDRLKLTEALVVDPSYLQYASASRAIDYRHWGVPLSRKFRALKLWFTIRTYGVVGLQNHIREHIRLAKIFERFVLEDDRFTEVEANFGLVCFKLKGSNALNKTLLSTINETGEIFLLGIMLEEKFFLRFCICSEHVKEEDVSFAWDVIRESATKVLAEFSE